jgi:hypothetical protein
VRAPSDRPALHLLTGRYIVATPDPKPRDPSPWHTRERVKNWKQLNDDLHDYGREWEKWGKDVLSELDALKQAARGGGTGGGTGGGPTDATQPPPPPFKKP